MEDAVPGFRAVRHLGWTCSWFLPYLWALSQQQQQQHEVACFCQLWQMLYAPYVFCLDPVSEAEGAFG